ncbi:exosortase C-terminal domain/associated protein EpsI [Desulfobacula toluolica]|uniref:EpsHI: exosortase I fusion protein n=1 Tax=Desulfobacula toluolica (strain DSM 7467 / Tol2) TaxID=651182 RepID=K0NGX2_DESTT|nr:EpsI domain-containing exosortase [Desulfobacula toluolica]CCK80491.1 EpsHI: exosortase I fusion protein [Desulfobacula toluolica Tol2]
MQTKYYYANLAVTINLVILSVSLILLYWQSFAFWIHTWVNDFDYHFGFAIPFLSFYVIWKKKYLFQDVTVKPSRVGLLLIIIALTAYIMGQASYSKIAQQISFFIIIPGIILFYFGFDILKLLFIPLLILIFMMPFPDFVYPYLQYFFTEASVNILRVLGIPVFSEGYSIIIPDTSVWVAPGCAGVRNITAIMPIGFAIAHLYFNSLWKKVSIVIVSAILPILGNLIRIVSLLIIPYKGKLIFVSGIPHKIHGYIIFIGALIMLFGFMSLLLRFGKSSVAGGEPITNCENQFRRFFQGFLSYRGVLIVVMILLVPLWVHFRIKSQADMPMIKSFKSFPSILGQWKGSELSQHEWRPQISGTTDNLCRLYRDADGNEIKVFISFMPIQKQGQELVFHANKNIPPKFSHAHQYLKTWNINVKPSPFKLKTTCANLNTGIQNETFLSWSRNIRRYVYNQYQAKIFMVLDSLLQNRSDGSVFVLVFKSSSHNKKDREIKLEKFLNIFINETTKYLPL